MENDATQQQLKEDKRLKNKKLLITITVSANIVAVILFASLWCAMNLIALWPEVNQELVKAVPAMGGGSDADSTIIRRSWTGSDSMWWTPIQLSGEMTPDVRAVILAMLAGALGAAIQVLTSIGGYLGNGTFEKRWTVWYLLRMPIGAVLGLFLVVGIQGGLPLESVTLDGSTPFQIVFLAGLAGLFSRSALDKLEDVFNVLLNTKRNDDRGDNMKPAKSSDQHEGEK
ncbi:MAG: hypothetical protein D8M52_05235 [Chlorobi bacterium]|nr:MAG: hypothetical protein F9K28_08825 [Bacteroidota bacterium]KXK34478.1 MAG: hypothetical protein UZ06_CHB003001209 [Chlorobi bacterium OLB6]MBL1161106.1 hypothetical protein [Chlorobiota bacterium]MBZ0194521.1 hypothetical protein [Candidatus Kapabacteria bacterium]MCL4277793.1 hypothetical protein [Ignavibacteria bacterium]